MFANGEKSSKVTIQLEQHDKQPNAYFSATRFQQADTYRLDTMTEYRSYFWETPVLHTYQPFSFKSQNKLIVRGKSTTATSTALALCDLKSNKTTEFRGAWVDKSNYEENHSQELYTAYENTENRYSINGKVFIPNTCQLEFKSNGQGARCLGKQIVHALGDNNLRRYDSF
jgi:hypothetical protein